MNHALTPLLNRYPLKTAEDYNIALREIIQKIALLALWRAKFYEHAAFYGGTALRIFYGLSRFSEDLDFSLTAANPAFSLAPFVNYIQAELEAFDFTVEVAKKNKKPGSPIESAFIKADTMLNLLSVEAPEALMASVHRNSVLKIRVEVDIDPPPGAAFETKTLLIPIPHQVKLYSKECLFAGKVHALLCRQWKTRVKGRDFYDFVWFIGQGIKCQLSHLKGRMVQTGHFKATDELSQVLLISLLKQRFEQVRLEGAREDVRPFLRDPQSLDLWNKEFFVALADKIETI